MRRYPNRLAVKTKTEELNYDELNRAANQVARAILAQRGEQQEPVALLLEQGITSAAAIMGVLKTGKFYVPLDPSYPCARLTYMVEDSQTGLIVTNNRNLPSGKELARQAHKLINVDELDSSLSTENLGASISPDSLAYIIYTSGSTGQPKGVLHNHRNILHEIMTYTNGFHTCAADRLTLLSSPSFIGAARDTFGALLNGAALYPFDLREKGIPYLADWLVQEEITIYRSVATAFRHFGNTLTGDQAFPTLRLVIVTGEPAYKHDVDLYKTYLSPDCILVARLGSTETLTFRWYFIEKGTQVAFDPVPAGYAFQDKEVLLLDDGHEVGIDQIGEIAIKSRYLSPGYWRRPDLTQTLFLPDPKGGNERIYLTGDLGRMLPDGCLIHMGRKDFQVKVRGHRVEVNEIELALLELDEVKAAVVMGREDAAGDQRLVAYLVPDTEPAPTIGELRTHLKEKLPDYMVPSAFVFLDALPLLPNGKVDRLALPAPSGARPELENDYLAPRTAAEETLVSIWAEVLGLALVGVHDNFLELGGDSLLAGQVISRVIGTFRVELPLRSLFEAPTVADMALAITQSQAEGAKPEDIERLLAELEALSAEQAELLLAEETPQVEARVS